MKHLITAALAILAITAHAQKHVYQDLLVLYVDEQYEKCLAKAENYTLNDATKKDPLPYLYMSMSLYEMSKIEKYQKDYPKASRDALKWAEKYRKKDRNLEYFANYEDFWAELNTMAMEQGENLYDDKAYAKAKQVFDAMVGYYPENPGAWIMFALCQYKTNLAKEGDLSMKEFAKANMNTDISRLPADQKKLLKNALIRYAEHVNTKGMRDSAKATLHIGKDHFMGENDFKGIYEEFN